VVVMVEIFTAATMEELERQGSAVTAWMDDLFSLGSLLIYIGLWV
jgi:hypothetical protein